MKKVLLPPPKICVSCGRKIEWRKSFEKNWDELRYCSQACRSAKLSALDLRIEALLIQKLSSLPRGSTLCPSEIARALGLEGELWRDEMERVRRAARRLVARGEAVILQSNHVVDPSTAKGPIRIRRLPE